MENWISLMDYSNKYQVSMSTLRRRIKNDQVGYQVRGGKYYISDKPMNTQIAHPANETNEMMSESSSDSHLSYEYFSELKKAYAQVLAEKEEHIQTLREEVADLKTLVNVLESENQRLSGNIVRDC